MNRLDEIMKPLNKFGYFFTMEFYTWNNEDERYQVNKNIKTKAKLFVCCAMMSLLAYHAIPELVFPLSFSTVIYVLECQIVNIFIISLWMHSYIMQNAMLQLYDMLNDIEETFYNILPSKREITIITERLYNILVAASLFFTPLWIFLYASNSVRRSLAVKYTVAIYAYYRVLNMFNVLSDLIELVKVINSQIQENTQINSNWNNCDMCTENNMDDFNSQKNRCKEWKIRKVMNKLCVKHLIRYVKLPVYFCDQKVSAMVHLNDGWFLKFLGLSSTSSNDLFVCFSLQTKACLVYTEYLLRRFLTMSSKERAQITLYVFPHSQVFLFIG